MIFAYADPPYVGQAKRHYGDDEIDHEALIKKLTTEYPDGWPRPGGGMTRTEFETAKATLACRHCGSVGLDTFSPGASDALVGARCPACGRKDPLDGVQWLPKDSATARRARPGKITTDEVWSANGNHCAFCGKPRWLCERLRIGLTVQHVRPVVFGGEDGPLVPYCARCQEASAAALRETRDVLSEIDSLDTIIKRIEANHPELRP